VFADELIYLGIEEALVAYIDYKTVGIHIR